MTKTFNEREWDKRKPISHEDAESSSPDESVAGEEDPGSALEDIVRERQEHERWKKDK
ncbi:hypothetical protein [Alteromonas halophila]|uniref:Uncharacterized protein n=1 Tax=Alteromonas halophila TaxID=516698 RepID=A0A918JPG4_9ALTE|nr:hypothetical protein [Alteromonas halophila]GGW92845.1 hypothetical protein GCM10007391_28860 [Alteromonas halophila]